MVVRVATGVILAMVQEGMVEMEAIALMEKAETAEMGATASMEEAVMAAMAEMDL